MNEQQHKQQQHQQQQNQQKSSRPPTKETIRSSRSTRSNIIRSKSENPKSSAATTIKSSINSIATTVPSGDSGYSRSAKRIKSKAMTSTKNMPESASNLRVHAIRLRPNQDLNQELEKYVKEHDIKAAFIMTCVGSLTRATLRMAYSGAETNEVSLFCMTTYELKS